MTTNGQGFKKRLLSFLHLFQNQNNYHEAKDSIATSLLSYAQMPLPDLFKKLKTSEQGLFEKEVRKRLKKFGPNEIAHSKPLTWYVLLLSYCKNPFVLLLIFLGILSYLFHDIEGTVIISCMVIVSIIMRFAQEFRSSQAAEKLKKLVSVKTAVLRVKNGEAKSVEEDIKYVVPGDIIHLSAGDLIPADVRLIAAKDVYISQAVLTGEVFPVEKSAIFSEQVKNPLDAPNLCFMGTNVLNGTAQALVLHTGNQTYFGSMAKNILGKRPLTSFDIGINKVSFLLLKCMLVVVPIVFCINMFTKWDLLNAFLFSLSVAVGLTPEMLPMIVTANLAKGAINMSKQKVIVKSLNAIQNFGAMNVLCTDKTGTLTQEKIILEKYLNAEGQESDQVLHYGYLNSYYQTGLKNLLDVAVLDHHDLEKTLKLGQAFRKVDEIPFDFSRRRMSVVLETEANKHLLICKGACEETVAICQYVRVGETVSPITDEMKKRLQALENDLNEDGLRVLAVGYKEVENGREYTTKDEQGLVFMGYLAFLDPPKQSATEAIKLLQQSNVQVKVLTGDNELITKRICSWVGLPEDGIVTGAQIEKMGDEELHAHVTNANIFAKLSPMQKTRVIGALKSNGNIVGYLGDGINDAPALREADIGISVDTATDIAKESADIIMLEKSLLFLSDGVLEGRRTFGNIIKYIKMTLSSNFGNIFSVIGASALFPFLPMMPIQLLTQNLLYDFSQTAIPFDHVDQEFLVEPRKWDPKGIAKFMFCIGPISSLFDYATFALMWFVFSANSIHMQALFQSGWFVEGLLSQILIVHMIRTRKIPFIQSRASLPLLATTVLIMAIGVSLPYTYVGHAIGLVSLPHTYFYWLCAILAGYCLLQQVVKEWFIKRFHYWM